MVALTEKEIEEGRKLIAALNNAGFQVSGAMWSYATSSDEWQLVLASPFVGKEGPREAYTLIQSVLARLCFVVGISLRAIVAVDANPEKARGSSNWFYRFDRLEHAYIYFAPEGEVNEMNRCEEAGFEHAWENLTVGVAYPTLPLSQPLRTEKCKNCGLVRRLLVSHKEEWIYGDEEFKKRITRGGG